MAKPLIGDHRGLVGEPPSDVRITVHTSSSPLSFRDAIHAVRRLVRPRWILALALVGVGIALATLGGQGPPTPRHARSLRAAELATSLGCPSLGVALHDPRFGQPAFDRIFPCAREVGTIELPGSLSDLRPSWDPLAIEPELVLEAFPVERGATPRRGRFRRVI